jgi:hypothetical protein
MNDIKSTKKIANFINKINSSNDSEFEELRIETIGSFIQIISSKKLFKNNKELEPFLFEFLRERFPRYVMRSRTAIIAKSVRIIQQFSKEDLEHLNSLLLKFIEVNEKRSNNVVSEKRTHTGQNKKEKQKNETDFLDYWTDVINKIKL